MRRAGNQFKRSFESERSTLSQNDLEMGTQLVIYEETDERKKAKRTCGEVADHRPPSWRCKVVSVGRWGMFSEEWLWRKA